MAKKKTSKQNNTSADSASESIFSKHKGWFVFGGVVIAIALVVLMLAGYLIGMYNSFVGMEQNVNSRWSEVENQYQRQADLIPNLIDITKSAVNVETKFVKDVIDARTRWQSAATQIQKEAAGAQMSSGLNAFVNAVSESYPTLQANKQYTALMDEVAGTQNRITVARGRYIESVQSYNTAIKRFPANIFAGMFGFAQKDYYKADLEAMTTPKLGTGQLP